MQSRKPVPPFWRLLLLDTSRWWADPLFIVLGVVLIIVVFQKRGIVAALAAFALVMIVRTVLYSLYLRRRR